MNYRAYLYTPHWRSFRLRAIVDAGYRCQRCGRGGALEVHHLTYANLGHEQPGDVQVLCRRCHKLAHGRLWWQRVWRWAVDKIKEWV